MGATGSRLTPECREKDAAKWAAISEDSLFQSGFVTDKLAELAASNSLTKQTLEEFKRASGSTGDEAETFRRALQVRQQAAVVAAPSEAAARAYQQDLGSWLEALAPGADASGFTTKVLSRLVLLERIFYARAAIAKSGEDKAKAKASSSQGHKRGASSVEATVSAAFGILMAFIRVSCRRDAETCGLLLEELSPIMAGLEPASLRDSDDKLPSVTAKGVNDLLKFLKPFISGSTDEAQASRALEAQLSIGVASGSLAVLLQVVESLLQNQRSVAAGSPLLAELDRLASVEGNFRLSAPRALLSGHPCSSPEVFSASGIASCAATDGSFLYVHGSAGLAKVGTGNGNVVGKVYAHNPDFHPGDSGTLACVGTQLYFRSPAVAPSGVEVVSAETLFATEDSATAEASCPLPAPTAGLPSYLCGDGRFLYCIHEAEGSGVVATEAGAGGGGGGGSAARSAAGGEAAERRSVARSVATRTTRVTLAPPPGSEAPVVSRNIVVSVVDPLSMAKVRTIPVREPSLLGLGPEDTFDKNGELQAVYTNGQRIVALLRRAVRGDDPEKSPPAHVKVAARVFNIDIGEVETQVDCGTLGALGVAEDKDAAARAMSSVGACYDAINNQVWLVAPSHAQQTLSRWRNNGVAPSIVLDSSSFDYSPEAVLLDAGISANSSTDCDSFAVAVSLLAHIDRLGGEEGAGFSALPGTNVEDEDIPLQEAFVIDVCAETCGSLVRVIQASLAAAAEGGESDDKRRAAAYAALAGMRVLRAQVARLGAASVDVDALRLRDALAPLNDTLMSLIQAAPPGLADDASALLINEAWDLLAAGFDIFTSGDDGGQGAFLNRLLEGDLISLDNPDYKKYTSNFVNSVTRRPDAAAVLLGGDDADKTVTSLLAFVASDSREALEQASTATSGAAAAADGSMTADAGSVTVSPVLMLLKVLARELVLKASRDISYSGTLAAFVQAVAAASSELVSTVLTGEGDDISPGELAALEASMVGALLPELCMSLLLVLSGNSVALANEVMPPLIELLEVVDRASAAARFKKAADEVDSATGGKKLKVSVGETSIESPHPYRSSMNTEDFVSVEGADYLEYSFTPNTHTESGCDHLTVFNGSDDSPSHERQYSGVASESSGSGFPTIPVVVQGSSLKLKFHSDGGVEYWGYKMKVVGYKNVSVTGSRDPWLTDLLKVLSRVVATGVRSLVVGEPVGPDESSAASRQWLTSPLFRNALEASGRALSSGDAPQPPQIARSASAIDRSAKQEFLDNLVAGTKGTVALSLFEQVKKKGGLMAKRGGAEADRAQRAVLAALLKHNGLVTEALAFARLQGRRASTMSPSLQRVFSRAKELRMWIVSKSTKQQMSFKEVADIVVGKASLLLELRPFYESPVAPKALAAAGKADDTEPEASSSEAAPSSSSGAPSMKWLKLKRHFSDSVSKARLLGSVVGKWSRLSDEDSGSDTPDDSIMSFVKSPTEVGTLHELLSRREARVVERATGVRLAHRVLTGTIQSSVVTSDLLRGLAAGLSQLRPRSGRSKGAQYLNGLEACNPEQVLRLRMAVHELFKAVLDVLQRCSSDSEQSEIAVLALRCWAIALDADDNALLKESNVFDTLSRLMDASGTDAVIARSTSQSSAAGAGNVGNDASEFCHTKMMSATLGGDPSFQSKYVEAAGLDVSSKDRGSGRRRSRSGSDTSESPSSESDSDGWEGDDKCGIIVPPVCFVPKDFSGDDSSDDEGATAPVDTGYFEVTVRALPTSGAISIGFVCNSDELHGRHVGWEYGCVGYHSDDGCAFTGSGDGTQFGPEFAVGDVIGCGINFKTREVFYSRNGSLLGVATSAHEQQRCWPAVGLEEGDGAVVTLNLGPVFLFDLKAYVTGTETVVKEVKKAHTADAADAVFRYLAIGVLASVRDATAAAQDSAAGLEVKEDEPVGPPPALSTFGRQLSSFAAEHESSAIASRGEFTSSAADAVVSVIDRELARAVIVLTEHKSVVDALVKEAAGGIQDKSDAVEAYERKLDEGVRLGLPDESRLISALTLLLSSEAAAAGGFVGASAEGARGERRREGTLARTENIVALLQVGSPRTCRLALRALAAIVPHLSPGQYNRIVGASMLADEPDGGWDASTIGADMLLQYVGSSAQALSGVLSSINGAPDWEVGSGGGGAAAAAAAAALAERDIKVGDKVRVKRSVSSPAHGFGPVTHDSVGEVLRISGSGCTIRFPEHSSWSGELHEMELVLDPSEIAAAAAASSGLSGAALARMTKRKAFAAPAGALGRIAHDLGLDAADAFRVMLGPDSLVRANFVAALGRAFRGVKDVIRPLAAGASLEAIAVRGMSGLWCTLGACAIASGPAAHPRPGSAVMVVPDDAGADATGNLAKLLRISEETSEALIVYDDTIATATAGSADIDNAGATPTRVEIVEASRLRSAAKLTASDIPVDVLIGALVDVSSVGGSVLKRLTPVEGAAVALIKHGVLRAIGQGISSSADVHALAASSQLAALLRVASDSAKLDGEVATASATAREIESRGIRLAETLKAAALAGSRSTKLTANTKDVQSLATWGDRPSLASFGFDAVLTFTTNPGSAPTKKGTVLRIEEAKGGAGGPAAAPVKTGPLEVGERVRVKRSVSSPAYGFGPVTHDSIGTILSISGTDCEVRFPEHSSWSGRLSEMERADAGGATTSDSDRPLQVGDRVRVKSSVSSPAYGFGSTVTHGLVGTLSSISGSDCRVDFPGHSNWMGKLAEMERVGGGTQTTGPLTVGDRVRVRPGVTPSYGFGSHVTHESVGTIASIDSDGDCSVNFPGHSGWSGKLSEMERADGPLPSASSAPLSVGDRVRVRRSVSSPRYSFGPHVTHDSVGVITSISGSDCCVNFPGASNWSGVVAEMERVGGPSGGGGVPSVGDRVRVKPSVSSPAYGWGSVSHSSVGTLTSISGSDCEINFPEHSSWSGKLSEIEKAESDAPSVGDRVRVKPSVSSPAYGWGPVSHSSVGTLTSISGGDCEINFPEHSSWSGKLSEIEKADSSSSSGSPSVGDRVRVKPSVSSPAYGWGPVSHSSVGTLTSISGGDCEINFPEHSSWSGKLSEIEKADSDSSSGSPSVGDRVRVKPSVASPAYGWGSVSHSSVGTLSSISGGDCEINFPEHSSWSGKLSEIEKAPADGDSGSPASAVGAVRFSVGDRVRVKRSVSEPAYGWGEVTHDMVGTVTALEGDSDCDVDFDVQSGWSARMADLELADASSLPLAVGDSVRVKRSVEEPAFGWGSVSHDSVGVLTEINGDNCEIDFEVQSGWSGRLSEIEKVVPERSGSFAAEPSDGAGAEVSATEVEDSAYGAIEERSTSVVFMLSSSSGPEANAATPGDEITMVAVRVDVPADGEPGESSLSLLVTDGRGNTTKTVADDIDISSGVEQTLRVQYKPGSPLVVFVGDDGDSPALVSDVDVATQAPFPIGQAHVGLESVCGKATASVNASVQFNPAADVNDVNTADLPELPADVPAALAEEAAAVAEEAEDVGLHVVWTDGRQLNAKSGPASMLDASDNSYLAKGSASDGVGCTVALQVDGAEPVVFQSATVTAAAMVRGLATIAPLGDAAFFVARSLPGDPAAATAAFAELTTSSYQSYVSGKRGSGAPPATSGSSLEPVGFVSLSAGASVGTIDFDFPSVGEFLVVRLLRARSDAASTAGVSGVGVQSLAVKGSYFDDPADAPKDPSAPIIDFSVQHSTSGDEVAAAAPDGYESVAVMKRESGSRRISVRRTGAPGGPTALNFVGKWLESISEAGAAGGAGNVQAGGPPTVGDKVRVKASVSSPAYGWGSVSHSSEGVITSISGGDCDIDFPEQSGWTGKVSELENLSAGGNDGSDGPPKPSSGTAVLRLSAPAGDANMADYSGPVRGTIHWTGEAASGGQLTWDSKVKVGPNQKVSDKGATVERTDSSGWGITRTEQVITKPTFVEIKISMTSGTQAFYVGVIRAGHSSVDDSGSSGGLWTMEGDGYIYSGGDSHGREGRDGLSGDHTVGLDIVPGSKLEFWVDGRKVGAARNVPKEVQVCVSNGSTHPKFTLLKTKKAPAGATGKPRGGGGGGCPLANCMVEVEGTIDESTINVAEQRLIVGDIEGWKPARYDLSRGGSGSWSMIDSAAARSGVVELRETTGTPITSVHVVPCGETIPPAHIAVPLKPFLPEGKEEERRLPPMKWDESRRGPDMEFSEGGLELTRTTSSGWGTQVADTWLTSERYIEVQVVSNTSDSMYLGVVSRDFRDLSISMSNSNAWCMQADNYLYKEGSFTVHATDRIRSGDMYGLRIVPGDLVEFYKDGTLVGTINGIASEVALAVCLGGSDQRFKINNDCGKGPAPPGKSRATNALLTFGAGPGVPVADVFLSRRSASSKTAPRFSGCIVATSDREWAPNPEKPSSKAPVTSLAEFDDDEADVVELWYRHHPSLPGAMRHAGAAFDITDGGLRASHSGEGRSAVLADVAVPGADEPAEALAVGGVSYFEAKIVGLSDSTLLSVGIASATFPVDGRDLGWNAMSFGLRSDGNVVNGLKAKDDEETPATPWPMGKSFSVGDTVGCGVCVATRDVFYTHNGELLGVAFDGSTLVADSRGRSVPETQLNFAAAANGECEIEFNFGSGEFSFGNVADAVAELTKRGELSEVKTGGKGGAGGAEAESAEKDAPIFPSTRSTSASGGSKEARKVTKSFFAGAPVVLSPDVRTLSKAKSAWYTLVDYPLYALAGMPGRVGQAGRSPGGGVSVQFFLPDVARSITVKVPPDYLLGATKSELETMSLASRQPVPTLPGAALEVAASLRNALSAGAALAAKQAVAAVLREWPADLATSVLGEHADIIKYVKLLFAMEFNEAETTGDAAPTGRGSLRDTLSRLLTPDKVSLFEALVRDCVASIASKSDDKKPKRRGGGGGGASDIVEVIESPHDYLPNAHETKSVTIPGATQLEVTFDPRCVSEQNYDQLFFTDETYSNKLQTYTGPTSRWPKEPVIVDGDTLHTLFTSDGSGQMWGYRLEVRAFGAVKGKGGSSNLISDSDVLKPRAEWGFWLIDFLLSSATRGLPSSDVAYSEDIIEALIAYLMAPGKPIALRKQCVTLLRRVLDGVSARKLPSAAVVKSHTAALGARLSKLAGESGSNIWRRPFAQSCVELMAAAAAAVDSLPKAGNAAGAEESKGEEEARESKDDDGAAAGPAAPVSVDIKWCTDKVGPRVTLEDDNKRLRISGAEQGSTQAADQWYTSGVHTITLLVEETGELPVGMWGVAGRNLMDMDWDEPVAECDSAIGLCLVPGGEAMSYLSGEQGRPMTSFPELQAGHRVTVEIDMEQRTLKVSVNGVGPEIYRDIPPEVCFAVSGVAGCSWLLESQTSVGGGDGAAPGVAGGNGVVGGQSTVERLSSKLLSATRALRLLGSRSEESAADLAQEMRTAVLEQFESHASLEATSGHGCFTLAPDGELVSNRAFPSLKASGIQLKKGKWYYEMAIISAGLVQVGWCDAEFTGNCDTGNGVGDDTHSWAYDGHRSVKFHGGSSSYGKRWSDGDIVGCAIDLDTGVCSFSLNGDFEDPMGLAFSDVSPTRYLAPAVSVSTGAKVRVSLKKADFSFAPPDEEHHAVAESVEQTHVTPAEVAEGLSDTTWTDDEDIQLVTLLNHAAYKGHCAVQDLKLPEVIKGGRRGQRERIRAALMRAVNKLWISALPLVNFMSFDELVRRGSEGAASGSLVAELLQNRALLFTSTKQQLWNQALSASSGGGSGERGIMISRERAIEAAKASHPDESTVRATQFGQMHSQLESVAPSMWRHKDRAWKINYEGEEGIDAGGLYNAHTSAICTELMEGSLWFFMPTPNGSNHAGLDRDRYMLRPSADQTWCLSMLEFLGRLMGVALRRQRPLNLSLSIVFWRRLVGQDVTLADLKSCDVTFWHQLHDLASTADDMTEEEFTDAVGERNFTAQNSEGSVVSLIPGGADTPLTLADRTRYIDAAVKLRSTESDAQVAAVRRGLTSIVPGHLLRMFAGEELEYMICGLPTVDVDLLKRTTEYSGCSKDDRFIKFFWEVLENDFTDAERVEFLSFAWGCSRLPNTEALLRPENCHLKISVQSVRGNPDNYYALAHTCFFQIELPRYTSREVCAQKLREAIVVGSKSGFLMG